MIFVTSTIVTDDKANRVFMTTNVMDAKYSKVGFDRCGCEADASRHCLWEDLSVLKRKNHERPVIPKAVHVDPWAPWKNAEAWLDLIFTCFDGFWEYGRCHCRVFTETSRILKVV